MQIVKNMIEKNLEKLDKFLGTEKKDPLPLPEIKKGGEIDFKDLYRESHGEMRALRDTEFKVSALFYQVSGFILAANMLVIPNPNITDAARFLTVLFSVIFMTILWFIVHIRIATDNSYYGFHMNIKRHIEENWFGDGFPGKPEGLKNNITGPGYRTTQAMVALLYTSVILIIVFALILKLHNYPA